MPDTATYQNAMPVPDGREAEAPILTIDQAVISQALIAAAREMGAKLVRSAYSPVVREASDCAAALLDRHGNVVAQAELIPMQLGPIGTTFRPCAALYPVDELSESDFYINNHPFDGGQHVPDVFLFTPIFVDGEVVGFGATVAHHLDLGGGAPGLNPEARDVYQEGLLFPPSKWNMKRDWNGGPLERLVRANVRVPAQTIGDFNAQFAANGVGVRRVQELCARHGAATVTRAMAELLDYSERRMRAAIREVPDGVYRGEDVLDDDGVGGGPLTVRATVTVAGDQVHVDFSGTAAQAPTNINCPFASTIAAALSCVKSVLTSPDIPFNEGSKRPITVTAPLGCLVNPRPPAPVRARMLSGYRVFNAVMNALAQVVPERVIAAGFDTTEVVCLTHLGDRRISHSTSRSSAAATARAPTATAATPWTARSPTAATSRSSRWTSTTTSSGCSSTACARGRAAPVATAAAWASAGATSSRGPR